MTRAVGSPSDRRAPSHRARIPAMSARPGSVAPGVQLSADRPRRISFAPISGRRPGVIQQRQQCDKHRANPRDSDNLHNPLDQWTPSRSIWRLAVGTRPRIVRGYPDALIREHRRAFAAGCVGVGGVAGCDGGAVAGGPHRYAALPRRRDEKRRRKNFRPKYVGKGFRGRGLLRDHPRRRGSVTRRFGKRGPAGPLTGRAEARPAPRPGFDQRGPRRSRRLGHGGSGHRDRLLGVDEGHRDDRGGA